jgi:hypothetical protein
MTWLVVILGLALLVLLHELGHFRVVRLVGMKPRAFYIGFPPAIVKSNGTRGVQKLGSWSESGVARRSIASRFPNFGGCAWAGRSSIWDCAGCFSWSCCCADRSVRRNLRSSCSAMSWRSCAGSRGAHRFDL